MIVQRLSNIARPTSRAQIQSLNCVFRATKISLQTNLSSRQFSTSRTRMSNSPGKYEWLIHVPDHPNALDKRLAIRATHLKNLTPNLDSGKVLMGGAILGSQPKEGETPDMKGSVILMRADSEEEALAFLREDAYTKGGAWDVDNAVVYPFKCAVRTAIEKK